MDNNERLILKFIQQRCNQHASVCLSVYLSVCLSVLRQEKSSQWISSLPLSVCVCLSNFLGSGPNWGRSPVEWGDFPFVHPPIRTFICPPPLGHQARPEAQPARHASCFMLGWLGLRHGWMAKRGEGRADGQTDGQRDGRTPIPSIELLNNSRRLGLVAPFSAYTSLLAPHGMSDHD